MRPPSGIQHELRHGEQRVVITEVGAGIRAYTLGSRAILDGYDDTEMCTGARGQALIPWPNRIKSGRYTWNGVAQQLDLTEPSKHGAIHGLTRWASWTLIEREDHRASLGYTLHACPGWPWALDCRIDYSLDERGLTVRTTATNAGTDACPWGDGAHPYLTVGTPTIDKAHAKVPGSVYLPVDGNGIPTGRESVWNTDYDLRSDTLIGTRKIDVTYTDLHRDDDGRARVRLSLPDGPAVSLWLDEAYPYLEIFTGDELPKPERRRTGLGVEPMTCAPNAFNSGEGLIVLQPGESHTASWGIEPSA